MKEPFHAFASSAPMLDHLVCSELSRLLKTACKAFVLSGKPGDAGEQKMMTIK
jgi:hypothetical protein